MREVPRVVDASRRLLGLRERLNGVRVELSHTLR